jgi:imidazolonepropionase-like amidohydrolase
MRRNEVKSTIGKKRCCRAAYGLLLTVHCLLSPVHAQLPETIAIRAGKIITLTGQPIENGVVLIRHGKIAAVGKNVPIPRHAKVMDASTKVVMPGLIAAFTTLAEQTDYEETIAPDVKAKDSFDFYADYKRLLEGGVTTAYVATGQRRLVSGQGAVVKLAGNDPAAQTLRASADVRVMLGEFPKNPPALFRPPIPPTSDHPILPAQRQFPSVRPSELAVLRQLFAEAKKTAMRDEGLGMRDKRGNSNNHPSSLIPHPSSLNKLSALVPILRGVAPLRVNAHTASDIQKALSFADEFKIKIVLEGATEAYKVAGEIAKRKVPAVVQVPTRLGKPVTEDWTRDGANGKVSLKNVATLVKAGVRVALTPSRDEDLPDLLLLAACEVQQGVSPDAALRTVTTNAAEILGVADRVGTLAVGKDADLIILSGDPMDARSKVEMTLLNGRIAGQWVNGSMGQWTTVDEHRSKARLMSRAESPSLPAQRQIGRRQSLRPTVATLSGKPPARQNGNPQPLTLNPVIAIKAGRILTVTQGDIFNGVILIRDGKIVAVNRAPIIPTGARVIDASLSVVMPGMIDVHSHLGLHADVEPAPLNPPSATTGQTSGRTKLVKAVNPNDPAFADALQAGVTAILLAPPTTGQVCGQGALLRTAGDERVIKEFAALCFNWQGNPRMAQPWTFRDLLLLAKDYHQRRAQYERDLKQWEHDNNDAKAQGKEEPREPAEVPKDEDLEPFAALFRKDAPAFVHVNRADEIINALKVFRDEFDLDVTLLDVSDGFRVPEEIHKRNAAAAFGPSVTRREKGKLINNAAALARAGVRVLFHSSATSGTQLLRLNAAYAVRNGLDPTDALRALTIYPATVLKVDDRLGSIEVGKDADLVILSSDPFDVTSRVQKVLVKGKVVYNEK